MFAGIFYLLLVPIYFVLLKFYKYLCNNLDSAKLPAGFTSTTTAFGESKNTSVSLYHLDKVFPMFPGIEASWLQWFIGFSEGDGGIYTYNGRMSFVLTQYE